MAGVMNDLRLSVLRHGQTAGNVAGIAQGQSQGCLNEQGKLQAQAAARRLSAEKFDALPDEEMDVILKVIDDGKERPKPKIEFEVGQQVRIKEGPFDSYEGIVEEVYPDRGQLKVNVHIFGRSTPVELGYHQVERT